MWQYVRDEYDWILERCRGRLRSAVAFSLAFKGLNLIVLAPLGGAILRLCLKLWGRASVGNFELAAFFMSPVGVVALLGVSGVVLASTYLEISGLMRLLADGGLHWWEAFKSSTKMFPRLVRLGVLQLAMFVSLAVPFLVGIGLVYWRFWSGKDLNALIILKPPEFWWGAGLAGALAFAYGVVALWLFLRQVYAVPILVFEGGADVRTALRSSAERSRGTLWRSAGFLAAWFVVQSVLGVIVLGSLRMALRLILDRSGHWVTTAVVATGGALLIHALVAMVLSILASLSLAAIGLSLYRQVAPVGALPVMMPKTRVARSDRRGWQMAGALIVGAAAAVFVGMMSIRGLKLDEEIEITAHRAGAAAAPENTVAALKQAIADGADWAEIDVQLTADKKLVVMHDIDLARVGGGSRRVDEAALEEIRALDVGTPMGQKFAGERIPTLMDMLRAAGENIRLNVELKPHDKEDALVLTQRVIDELREAKMVARCRLCSQSYESLQLARTLEPELPVGYIVATAIGDPTKLDVDFLMVKTNLATREFVDRAALRKIAVHGWTVNDPALVAPLLDAGVANIITDDPAGMRKQLDQILALEAPQRLLLRAAHAIAL